MQRSRPRCWLAIDGSGPCRDHEDYLEHFIALRLLQVVLDGLEMGTRDVLPENWSILRRVTQLDRMHPGSIVLMAVRRLRVAPLLSANCAMGVTAGIVAGDVSLLLHTFERS